MRVLFLTNHPVEDGSSRYRIYQFLPALQSMGIHSEVRPFSTEWLFRALRHRGNFVGKSMHACFCAARRLIDLWNLNSFDAIVIHREVFPFFSPAIESLVCRLHSKVLFSFDDAIYAGHSETQVLNHPLLYKFKYGAGIGRLLVRCSGIIAGNQTLAAYAGRFNKHVEVIPTVVDLDQYQLRASRRRELISIGWFGSPSTSSYLQMIEPALIRLLEKFPNRVEFKFFGDPNRKLRVPAQLRPFNLETEISDLSELDIGLMPMPDNEWTRGKCAFKAIQYMALGIPTIVSPVGMACEVVQHDRNGLWAIDENSWFSAMEMLVQDENTRARLSTAGRRTVETRYSMQLWAPKLADLLYRFSGEYSSVGLEDHSWT